jgi:hypothetical protein
MLNSRSFVTLRKTWSCPPCFLFKTRKIEISILPYLQSVKEIVIDVDHPSTARSEGSSIGKVMKTKGMLVRLLSSVAIIMTPSGVKALQEVDSAHVVIISQNEESVNSCEGVAIAARTVITAAHCIDESKPQLVRLVLRDRNLNVVRMQIHPLYNKKTRIPRFDVAVITTEVDITDNPIPIILSSAPRSGDVFSIFNLGTDGEIGRRTRPLTRELIVADTERMILNYINYRRGTFPNSLVVNALESLLTRGDPRVRKKIANEFGDFIFSLHSESGTSISRGESGTPAVIAVNGRVGVFGLATAITQLEQSVSSEREPGSTSIFLSLNHNEIVRFIRDYDVSVAFL